MKNIKSYIILFFTGLMFTATLASASPTAASHIRVMTYNIRFANPDDGMNYWPERKNKLLAMVKEINPDIFGIQEGLKSQVDDISGYLPEYKSFGVGRDDGKEAGEYAAIFYNARKFEFLDGGNFWLSETPEKAGSKGWDAACVRIVTWVKLKQTETGKVFFHFNTHFDHMGQRARKNSARLVLKKTKEMTCGLPFFLTGDFNGTPDSKPYRIITRSLHDSRKISKQKPTGPNYSYTGFPVKNHESELIDFIFVKKGLSVIKTGIVDKNDGMNFPSDHLPVFAEIEF